MRDEIDALLKRVGENMLRVIETNGSAAAVLNQTIASVTPAALAWTARKTPPPLDLLERASAAFLAVVLATEYQNRQRAKEVGGNKERTSTV